VLAEATKPHLKQYEEAYRNSHRYFYNQAFYAKFNPTRCQWTLANSSPPPRYNSRALDSQITLRSRSATSWYCWGARTHEIMLNQATPAETNSAPARIATSSAFPCRIWGYRNQQNPNTSAAHRFTTFSMCPLNHLDLPGTL
jgi:hypothetical protein